MKKLFIILTLIPVFFTSCNKDEVGMNDKTVEVSFTAELPQEILTRASSELSVNTVVCAVFEDGSEIEALRESKTITDPSAIEFGLPLVKGRSYNVVFWAMKDGNYDVTDMKAIKRSATGSINETDYDAFTATTSITVQDAVTLPLTLTRPLAQVNFGVTELDWNTAALQFSQKPTTATITYQASDTFNALTGETELGSTEIIRRSSCTGSAMSVESVTYKHLGTFYVLMSETERETLDVTCNVLDQNATSIRSDIRIPFVPVQRNYKTNIVGGLLAGTVTYQITLKDFADEEINEDI